MALDLASLVKLRPMLYHLTARENLNAIWGVNPKVLRSAAELIRGIGGKDRARRIQRLLRQRRPEALRIEVAGRTAVLRDQGPLHAGNIAFEDGLTFDGLVQLLNERVYFWPGDERGPVVAGRNHFARYTLKEPEDCVVFAALLAANADSTPQLSCCNSGSPRCNPISGKAPRGPRTFLPAESFEGTASEVVEVTFLGSVVLPPEAVEVVSGAEARWRGWAG